MRYVFTSVAANYLPKAQVLCESLRRFHPEFKIYIALADRVSSDLRIEGDAFDGVLDVEQLAIPKLRGWIFSHSLVELATAIKPFVLLDLLQRDDCDSVLYFDPDIALFSRLDDLLDQLSTANVVLTPHLTKPEDELEAIRDNEICALRHGLYNLGFIGVRKTDESKRFATWWRDRLYDFCQEALAEGLWTDQKWIDFAPVFFDDVKVIKSSRFNVAPWNISKRNISGSLSSGIKVDNESLGFYHFTGFDSGAHRLMARKYASSNKTVMELIKWYAKKCAAMTQQNVRWGYATFENGETILREHRRIYRLRKDLQMAYPDPFLVSDGEPSYLTWLRTQGPMEYPELLLGNRSEDGSNSKDMDQGDVGPTRGVGGLRSGLRRSMRRLKSEFSRGHGISELVRKTWRVYRQEGVGGIVARLNK